MEVEDDEADNSAEHSVLPKRLFGFVRPSSIATEDTILRRRLTVRNYDNDVKKERKIFECIGIERNPAIAFDGDVLSFMNMVREVRRNFKWNDSLTNPGSITAVKLEASYPPNTEVKLTGLKGTDSMKFTASIDMDLNAIVAIALVVSDPDIGKNREEKLKVQGMAEYMCGGILSDYDYVHQCFRYDKDVALTLAYKDSISKTLASTENDDENDSEISFNQISPFDSMKTLSYNDLRILLGTLQKEAESENVKDLQVVVKKWVMPALRPKQLLFLPYLVVSRILINMLKISWQA